ncbi:Receptor-type tyrosine-protein phosphatase eta [Rhizoctonia solani]|uniref:Receptor-type tyrosine-protein phosphatase eta n=1 Tax=Rhizoctonia solani TaxID=456999 RepID=A0A0K6FW51_9AGAM|nr:Receptor-type tyrosine-protein phosphatase eta [Rhizoctonia solani]
MDPTRKPSTVLGAVDDLLLRVGAAFPSSDPQDMHVYATKAPSQSFLREIIDITQSLSNALITMHPVGDSKAISLLKEHATHDQVVFERQDLSRRACEILPHQGHHWVEDIPLDPKLRPDFILLRVEKWAKGAKMEVYQSDENGQNTLTCAGSAVVLDLMFEKSAMETDRPTIRLVSLKTSYPTSKESTPVTQPSTTVEDLLGADITAYATEVLGNDADATKAAELAWRVMGHIQYIMFLDAQAAREAVAGETGARWFAEVGVLSPKVIDLACQEATGLSSQLQTHKAPLDIFLRRAHALPLVNLNSPSISFLIGVTPISYLSLLKASSNHIDIPTSDPQPNIDIPINLLRRFVAQYPTPPGITTCNLIVVSDNQSMSGSIHHSPPRVPYFPLLSVPSVSSQSHAFPLPGGDNSWVLDFGAKGLVMRRSAMQALVQALGHVSDIDVTLSGMGFINLGMGLMNEDNPGWISMLLQRRSRILAEHLYATQTSPNQLFPPVHLTLRVPNEAGFVLGRVRVRNMAEVWTTLEIVREQTWLNNIVTSYAWEDIPPEYTEAPKATGLANLLSGVCYLTSVKYILMSQLRTGLKGQFLSIPTQMNVSTGSAPLSLLLQFPIPSKGGVPSVVQFMVSYDPTATRGTGIQFGTLDSKLSVTETLGRFEDQVDEVMGSHYSETLNEWPPCDEKAPRKAFSLAPGMFSFFFDRQSHQSEPTEDVTREVENQLLPVFVEPQFETAALRQRAGPGQELKYTSASRFLNISDEWERSGWGSVTYLELTTEQLNQAHIRMNQPERQMGQFRSSSLSGNGILGSAFYTFPAMATVASIFSPLSLLIASLIMTIYRPILLELGSAFRLNGTNYVYLLQCSGRTLAAVGATATLLDAVAASVVSAAAAGAYIKAEFPEIPATDHTIGIYLLVAMALLALVTLRESGKLTLVITIIHMVVMAVLMVGSAIAWTHTGTEMIRHNWELRPTGVANIIRSIYIGICVGITGFECSPGYIQSIKPGSYGHALRNLLIMSLLLNVPLVLLVYALLPNEVIMRTDNLLVILAETSFGKPMRIVIVVDCLLVFSVGMFAGVSTGCNLVEALARERVLPQLFLRPLPFSGATYFPVLLFVIISLVVYFSSAFSLSTVSTMVSAAFVSTMLLSILPFA